MADRFYIGTDGDFSKDSNWSATRGGASVNDAPDADDVAYIENLNHAMNTGLSQGSVDLQGLHVSIAPGGSLGSPSSPLHIDVSNVSTGTPITRIRNFGSSPVYLAGDHDLLHISSAAGVVLGGGGTSTMGNIYLSQGGLCTVKDGVSATAIASTGMNVVIEAGTGGIAALNMLRGVATTSRNITTASLYGNARLRTLLTAALTTANVFPNSTLQHNSSGTIGTIYVLTGATATAAGAPYPFTVTNSTLYAGGSLFDDAPGGLITYTNDTQLIGF